MVAGAANRHGLVQAPQARSVRKVEPVGSQTLRQGFKRLVTLDPTRCRSRGTSGSG